MSTDLFPGLQFLSTYERDLVRSWINAAAAYANLNSVSVTYRRLNLASGGSASVNQTTGVVTTPYSDATISCLMGAVAREDESLMGATIQDSDRKFIMDRADLSADPTNRDQIIYNSTTYDVYKVVYCEISKFVLAYARVAGGGA